MFENPLLARYRSDSEESDSASESEQNEPSSSLASDSEQYELMEAALSKLAVTSKIKERLSGRSTASSGDWSWFLKDGPLRDLPFPCKRVWISLTGC